jgi:hypothetical protein
MKEGDLIYDKKHNTFATIGWLFDDGAVVKWEKPQQNAEFLKWNEMALPLNIDDLVVDRVHLI